MKVRAGERPRRLEMLASHGDGLFGRETGASQLVDHGDLPQLPRDITHKTRSGAVRAQAGVPLTGRSRARARLEI